MWLWVCSGDGGELSCRSEIMESKRKEKKSLVKHVASLRHFNHNEKKKKKNHVCSPPSKVVRIEVLRRIGERVP